MPALGTDVCAQTAVHEQGVGVGTPRTPQVNLRRSVGSLQVAVVEHVAVAHFLWRGGGGDVGIDLAQDGAVLEPGRRWAEDKVSGAFDIAVEEIDACAACAGVDRVLVAQQTTALEHQSVALGMQGHGLPKACCVVLDGDVLKSDVCAFHLHRIGAEGAHRLGAGSGLLGVRGIGADFWNLYVGMVVVGDDGCLWVFATNLNVGEPGWNDELFLVDASLHEDDLMVLHECAAHLDGLADGSELACAVASHENGVGVVVALGCCGTDKEKTENQ